METIHLPPPLSRFQADRSGRPPHRRPVLGRRSDGSRLRQHHAQDPLRSHLPSHFFPVRSCKAVAIRTQRHTRPEVLPFPPLIAPHAATGSRGHGSERMYPNTPRRYERTKHERHRNAPATKKTLPKTAKPQPTPSGKAHLRLPGAASARAPDARTPNDIGPPQGFGRADAHRIPCSPARRRKPSRRPPVTRRR